MKKILAVEFVIVVLIVVMLSFNNNCMAKDFNDLPSTHWAYQYVSKLSDEGTINGYEDGSFKPSNQVSKAEYIKLLVACTTNEVEAEKLKMSQSFYLNWFEPYFEYAYNQGFFDYRMGADELKTGTTREEMANILVGFLNKLPIKNQGGVNNISTEIKISADEVAQHYGEGEYTIVDFIPFDDITNDNFDSQEYVELNNNAYSDINDLDSDSIDNIYRCSNLGIMNGYEDGTFKPDGIMTRAEVSVVISRFKQLIGSNGTTEPKVIN